MVTTVLIAEDDSSIAGLLEDLLVGNGYAICGCATTASEAIALGERHRPDLAVLDVHLANDGLGPDVAAALQKGGRCGVLYATGSITRTGLRGAIGDAFITKPYTARGMMAALRIVTAIAAGQAPGPLPPGMHLLDDPPT
jgi:DNA-binding response OmpR family regulator